MTNTFENVLAPDAPVQTGKRYRAAHQELLDSLPPDIVREMARRRHEELKAAGYDVPDWAPAPAATVTMEALV